MRQIKIFDTTLRDGEQSPGCSMNLREKLRVAACLEKLHVDVIEAGFAIASPGDFESVEAISKAVKDCTVASLARATRGDIDRAWEAVKGAADPRIHLFIATSPLHMEYKLKMKPEDVLAQITEMTAYAKKYVSNIEFSAEDATRSDPAFLAKAVRSAIAAGATVVNIPDTVGYSTPAEMQALIEYLIREVPETRGIELSVHCHNDLGMAVANSLAGVLGGAAQIECTIDGLGERAGNTSLEEVVMALRTRQDVYQAQTRIDTTQIYRSSKTVYDIIGQTAPLNKPIVGKNAFLHESGIHQHGVLANKQTYEIMTPESVGVRGDNLVLGKHSGRHAFEARLRELGYELTPDELTRCFADFKALCDKKKSITDADLEALIAHGARADGEPEELYKLDWFAVHTTNFTTATATICLRKGEEKLQAVSLGDGPIDAAFQAVDEIVKPAEHQFATFTIKSISEGKDTLGDVNLKLSAMGRTFRGHGLSTDIIEAGILAYLGALNRLCAYQAKQEGEQ